MFRYVIFEKGYKEGKFVQRAIVGTNSRLYCKELFDRIVREQNLKKFKHSWFCINIYGCGNDNEDIFGL